MAISQEATVFGSVAQMDKEGNAGIFIPAQVASLMTGAWTPTRLAAGSYVMRKTAGAAVGQAVFHLGNLLVQRFGTDPLAAKGQARDIRGVEVTAIDVIYAIGTANLNAHTYDLHETTFANNAAPAVVSTVGATLTGTLATATQAQPYVTQIALSSPWVPGQNVALRNGVLEISWDAAATTVLDYFGIFLRCNYSLL